MDFEAIFARIPQVLRNYWYVFILAIVGLIFFVYGLISLFVPNSSNSGNNFPDTKPAQAVSPITISVDVEGAVVSPGVYKLPLNSIIQDALLLSKGLSQEADREYVSKNLNLAQKITDGSKIYIPKIGEAVSQSQTQSANPSSVSSGGLINTNSASQDDLNSLPGVGPVTSQKIINARPYSSINDLLDRKIVSNKVFTEIKDKITSY